MSALLSLLLLSVIRTGEARTEDLLDRATCVLRYEAVVLASSPEMGFDQRFPFRGVGTAIDSRLVAVPRQAFAMDAAQLLGFDEGAGDDGGDFGMPSFEVRVEALAVWVGERRCAARSVHDAKEWGLTVLEVDLPEGETLDTVLPAETEGTPDAPLPSLGVGTSLYQVTRASTTFDRVPLLRRLDVIGRTVRPVPGLLLEPSATLAAPLFDAAGRLHGLAVPGPASANETGPLGHGAEPILLITPQTLRDLRDEARSQREL